MYSEEALTHTYRNIHRSSQLYTKWNILCYHKHRHHQWLHPIPLSGQNQCKANGGKDLHCLIHWHTHGNRFLQQLAQTRDLNSSWPPDPMVSSVFSTEHLDTTVGVPQTLCILQYLGQISSCSSIWLPTSYLTHRTACVMPVSSHTVCLASQGSLNLNPQHSQFLMTWNLSSGCTQTPLHRQKHTCMKNPSSRQTGRHGVQWEARTSCRHKTQGSAVYTEKYITLLAVYTKQPPVTPCSLYFPSFFPSQPAPIPPFLSLCNLPKNAIIIVQSQMLFPDEPIWPHTHTPLAPLGW